MGDGPQLFQTRMGQQYYEHTLPSLVKSIEHLATALEKQQMPQLTEVVSNLDADEIIKNSSEDELFSLFHKFKEYWNQMYGPKETMFEPRDTQIGVIIEQMKQNYK